ncbi:asparagine synthase (glutamine-hydrolyzing) [Aliarcobacter butzleri]|nr:asparagine synthase (glutamine-hydrolyzing) [Aliarcobacter butzleri]MDK2047655.1 asparagine synthase (glutamine-hydrolyzing) [Aliarcobacter butzleri]
MLERIYLRGPDGEGRYSENGIELGMRRLSIIDIAGGQQPFFSRNNQIVAFQNGEIYNFIELREELEQKGYVFLSHSDTEILAHGYAEWGIEDLLKKLEGMYAISIYDKSLNKIFLARDRFGEKPLYYSINQQDKQFAYSSDLRSILNLNWVDKKLSKTALSRYLMLGFTTGENSIIDSIKKVLPAHYAVLDLNNFSFELKCYYLPNLFDNLNEKNKKDKLNKILNHSIDLRLRSDVPVGVFLSGGIDSSIVAGIVASKRKNIDTFSIGFHSDKYDESKYAKEVAKHIKSNHHHFMFDEDNFIEFLPSVVKELDEPLADQACLPTYWLSKEARKYVTVVLSGEGADEIFGGYGYYKQFHNGNNLSKLVKNESNITPSGFPLLMSIDTCKDFFNNSFDEETKFEKQLFDWLDTSDGIKKAMASDLTTWLPDNLLVKLDRMAMANSLEGRTPYLSHHLVDFCLGLDEGEYIKEDEYKVLLRSIGKDFLPSSIFNRPKQGFVLPMDQWLVSWFKQNDIKDFFMHREIKELNTQKVIGWVINELKQPVFNQRLVFALVMLYEWYGINFKGLK